MPKNLNSALKAKALTFKAKAIKIWPGGQGQASRNTSLATTKEKRADAGNLASNNEKVDMACEVHWQQQCHETTYDRNALVTWYKERSISIIPQTLTAIRSSSTHTSTAIRLHHSMQHLSISPSKIDYIFQMLQTQYALQASTTIYWSRHLISSLHFSTAVTNNVQVGWHSKLLYLHSPHTATESTEFFWLNPKTVTRQ